MFGKNPVRKTEYELDGQQLWVQEVFATIQGEGPFAGQSAVFVRIAGCSLRCFWCDTQFESSSWNPTLPELLDRIHQEHQKVPKATLIVITGGEPMRQNIVPLCRALLAENFRVQIETAGTVWPPQFDEKFFRAAHGRFTIVCSPKTPKLNSRIVARARYMKYIIRAGETDEQDGLPIMSTQLPGIEARLARPAKGVITYVQPMDEGNPIMNRANMTEAARVAMQFGYLLSLQTHKTVGLP